MEFCPICDYKLYLKEKGEGVLEKECKNCKYTEKVDKGPIKISETFYSFDDLLIQQYRDNVHLSYDPALPRLHDIQCQNPECTKQPDEPNSIISVKYHYTDMRYLFKCEYCGKITTLKNES